MQQGIHSRISAERTPVESDGLDFSCGVAAVVVLEVEASVTEVRFERERRHVRWTHEYECGSFFTDCHWSRLVLCFCASVRPADDALHVEFAGAR